MKTKLSLLPLNRGPFHCLPAREIELENEKILCNDVTLPWGFNPHSVRLYVIGNEFGPLGAIWADCDQDAFDILIDEDLGESLLVSAEDQEKADESEREEWAHLGNAGEPCDLTNVWVQLVRLEPTLDCQLLCAFAYADGAGQTTLDN